MKIECPNCWQHFEVDEADLDAEFTCPNCNFQFIGRHAPRLPRETRIWPLAVLIAVLITLLAVSIAGNFWLWRHTGDKRPLPPPSPTAGLTTMTALVESYRDQSRRDAEQFRHELAAQSELLRKLERRAEVNSAGLSEVRERQNKQAGFDARIGRLEALHEKYSLEVMSGLLESLRKRVLQKNPSSSRNK